MRKVYTLILAIMAGVSAVWAENQCGDNLTWEYNPTTTTLTITGSGAMTAFSNSDAVPWKDYKNAITSVSLPNGLTTIGKSAFKDCIALTSITIPASVTNLANFAFNGSALESITFANGSALETIGDQAFKACTGLTNITLPSGVTSIGVQLFNGCTALTSVTIPASLTDITGTTFAYCTGLKDVTVKWTNLSGVTINATAFDNVPLGNVNLHVPAGTYATYAAAEPWKKFKIKDPDYSGTCGDNLTWEYDPSTTTLTISGSGAMYDYGSFDIGSNDFTRAAPWMEKYWKQIQSVVVGEGVTQIGNYAFYHCTNLVSVSLPSSLTSIGKDAFYFCKSLPTINFPEGLKSIGNAAFEECRILTSVVLPASLESLEAFAFQSCDKLTSVELPASLKTIGNHVFQESLKISDVTVHWTSLEGVSIGKDIFYGHSNLGSINLHVPYGTKSIYTAADPWKNMTIVEAIPSGTCGDNLTWEYDPSTTTLTISGTGKMTDYYVANQPWAEYKSAIQHIVIENGVTNIGKYAFWYHQALTSITIPSSVNTISDYAFVGCINLTSVTIPSSVTSIGEKAFYFCFVLKEVIALPTTASYVGTDVFIDCSPDLMITYPCGCRESYATQWSEYADKLVSACPVTTMDDIYSTSQNVPLISVAKDILCENWVVSGLYTVTSPYTYDCVFITDGEKGFLMDMGQTPPVTLAVGDTLNGYLLNANIKKLSAYQTVTITTANMNVSHLTVTHDGIVTPLVKTIDQLSGINTGAPVTLKNLECTALSAELATMSDGTNTINVATRLFADALAGLEVGKHYDITGIFHSWKTTDPNRIYPRSAADIVEQTATGIESQKSKVESRKLLRNGQLFIERNGVRYNAQGGLVD